MFPTEVGSAMDETLVAGPVWIMDGTYFLKEIMVLSATGSYFYACELTSSSIDCNMDHVKQYSSFAKHAKEWFIILLFRSP